MFHRREQSKRRGIVIAVDPRFDALYYGYYLHGIHGLGGAPKVRYELLDGFPDDKGLRLIIKGPQEKRVFICAEDSAELRPEAVEWAHCYAKVNVAAEPDVVLPHNVLPIGPSFGIRAWPLVQAIIQTCQITLKCQSLDYAAGYYRQWRHRLPLGSYQASSTPERYVFFTGSIWKKEAEVNDTRARFVRVARRMLGQGFEGGLAPRKRNDVPGYEDVTLARRYSLREYLAKCRRSRVVFNTPGVLQCHGWKLGEFLAMGKAIISLPIRRLLPEPLVHGKHVHFIDGSEREIEQAIRVLLDDEEYRRHLEANAREYFERLLAPTAVFRRILEFLGSS